MRKKFATPARIILGLIYFIFGLNAFFILIPMNPPPMPEAATGFLEAIMKSGYFFSVLKGTETIGGLMLLTGIAAPVGLVVLAPVTLHIFLFHAFLTPGPENLILPLAMGSLHILAATGYWPLYRPLFTRGQWGETVKN